MAVYREPEICHNCGEPYKEIHAEHSQPFVGDTFIGWDYQGHVCLKVTPDPVEPTAKEQTTEKFLREAFGEECIKNSSKFIALLMEQGVPMLYPDSRQRTYIYKAMQAYASQERSKAIQECIDTLLKLDTKILFGGKVYMSDNIGALEKLKTKSI